MSFFDADATDEEEDAVSMYSVSSFGDEDAGSMGPRALAVGNMLQFKVAYELRGDVVWKIFDRKDIFAAAGVIALDRNLEAPTEVEVFDLLLQGARQHAVKLTGEALGPGLLFILVHGKPRATTMTGIRKLESVLAEEDNLWEHVRDGILYMRYNAAASPSGRKRGTPDAPSAPAATFPTTASASSASAAAAAPPASASSASAAAATPSASFSPHTAGAAPKRPRAAGHPDVDEDEIPGTNTLHVVIKGIVIWKQKGDLPPELEVISLPEPRVLPPIVMSGERRCVLNRNFYIRQQGDTFTTVGTAIVEELQTSPVSVEHSGHVIHARPFPQLFQKASGVGIVQITGLSALPVVEKYM